MFLLVLTWPRLMNYCGRFDQVNVTQQKTRLFDPEFDQLMWFDNVDMKVP